MDASPSGVVALIATIRARIETATAQHRTLELPGAFGAAPFGAAPFGAGRVVQVPVWDRARILSLKAAIHHIEITQRTINSFSPESSTHDGEAWLQLFGALQAMYVQQDAISHLLATLGIENDLVKQWQRVREVRNSTIGHPVERFKGAPRSSFFPEFVEPGSMRMIRLKRVFYDGQPDLEELIELAALVERQREVACQALQITLAELDKRLTLPAREQVDG